MYQGEKRKLYLSVKSEDNLPFEITSARYEVWNCDTNEKEAEGTCEIDDHVLPCTMQASTTGLHGHNLVFLYVIMLRLKRINRMQKIPFPS